MSESMYDIGANDGERYYKRQLQPLIDAVYDAVYMLEEIEQARQLPAYAEVHRQYIMMGRELRRLLAAYQMERSKGANDG